MDNRLDNYDWSEVFGEGSGGNCNLIIPNPQPPTSTVNVASFGREDVAQIIQMEDGVSDELDWIIYGQLKDGRFFAARGGCDYTGWDCQASNSGDVATSLEDLKRFGLSEDERHRFGIKLEVNEAHGPKETP